MILFHNDYKEIFNLFIRNLLEKEKRLEKNDFGNTVEKIMPKYLRREQFKSCENAFENLYEWSNDGFVHKLTVFEKLALYRLIAYEKSKGNNKIENPIFIKKLDENLKKHLLKSKKIRNNFLDLDWYMSQLKDSFLIEVEDLYYNGKLKYYLNKRPELIDIYWDILPLEFQEKWKPKDDLHAKVTNLLEFIQENISNGSLSYLFWKQGKPRSEPEIQILLENIIDAYFDNQEVDINRESLVGRGKIDFKFYKNKKEIIIFELKKASNSHLIDGYTNQLVEYMKSIHCKKAFYVIICFNEKELKKAKKFIKNREFTDEYHTLIEPIIFNVRIDNKKIPNKNKSIFYTNTSKNIDNYFNMIPQILNISTKKEILNYLKSLQSNYHELKEEELEEQYIKKIIEITLNNTKHRNVFDFESFYTIEKSLRNLTLHFLLDIKLINNIDKVISPIIDFYNDFQNENITKRISENEIKKIFLFIEKTNPSFYKILKRIYLKIFLIDLKNEKANSCCIPTKRFNSYTLVCTKMTENSISPIYAFFTLLGYVLIGLVTKKSDRIPISFLITMYPYTRNLAEKDPEALAFFAESFANYLIHDTKYEKYSPYLDISNDVYIKLKQYFDKLLKEIKIKGEDEYDFI